MGLRATRENPTPGQVGQHYDTCLFLYIFFPPSGDEGRADVGWDRRGGGVIRFRLLCFFFSAPSAFITTVSAERKVSVSHLQTLTARAHHISRAALSKYYMGWCVRASEPTSAAK